MTGARLRMRRNQPNPARLKLLGTPVEVATENQVYAGFTLEARGGTAPYIFDMPEGQLPDGVATSGAGATRTISGTPTEFGTFAEIVHRVTDSSDPPQVATVGPYDLVVAEAPGGLALPASQSVDFWSKTRLGHAGHPLQYEGNGYLSVTAEANGSDAVSTHWRIDGRNMLVPRNGGAQTYGAAPPTFNGPYSLTVTEYSDAGKTTPTGVTGSVTVNMTAAAAGAREMTVAGADALADEMNTSARRSQLGTYLQSSSILAKGDTVVHRGGWLNPTSLSASIRPPAPTGAASWTNPGVGAGVVLVRGESPDDGVDEFGVRTLQHPAKIGALFIASNISGDIAIPLTFESIEFYCDQPTFAGGISKMSSGGGGVSYRNCRFACGPSVPLLPNPDSESPIKDISQISGLAVRSRADLQARVEDSLFEHIGDGVIESAGSTGLYLGHLEFRDFYADAIKLVGEDQDVEFIFVHKPRFFEGAHKDALQHHGFKDDLVHIGPRVSNFVALAEVGSQLQAVFCADNTGASRLKDAIFRGIGVLIDKAQGVWGTLFTNPLVESVTALRIPGGTNTPTVNVSGEGGTFRRILVGANMLTPSGSTVEDVVILPYNEADPWASYTSALPNFTEANLAAAETIEDALLMLTPAADGPAHLGGGLYAGYLFPPADGETIGAYNDGSVFQPSDEEWKSAHPPMHEVWAATAGTY